MIQIIPEGKVQISGSASLTELGNKSKAREAMMFHEMKTVIQTGIVIIVCQLVLYIILSLVR